MKRLPIPVFLLSLLLIMTACSMPYIADIPEWMTGDWDIYNENNINIGLCRINKSQIRITISEYGYEQFDLINWLYQNGGWTEAASDSYTLYLDYTGDEYIRFIKAESSYLNLESRRNNYISTFRLQKL